MAKLSTYSLACLLSVFIPFTFSQATYGNTKTTESKFVDPHKGNDRYSGKIDEPFQTIKKAIQELHSGGNIYLRNGVYRESNIQINNRRDLSEPLIISSYMSENAVIDGSFGEFAFPHQNSWKLFDVDKNIFISSNSFPGLKNIFGQINIGDRYYKLVSYRDYNDLSSLNGQFMNEGNIYIGPGIHYSQDSGRIFIRLTPPSNLPMLGLYSHPLDINPNYNAIALSSTNYGFIINDCNSHHPIIISNLTISNHYASLLASSSHNIVISNVQFYPNKYGILVKNESSNVLIERSNFDQNIPDWIAWSDVKIGTKPARSLQNNDIEINHNSNNISVEECIFHKSWDAINAIYSSDKLRFVNNLFTGVRDDCIQLGSSTSNVEIAHNKMIHVFTAVARHGSGYNSDPGSKFIHHNVIDCTSPMYVGRSDPSKTVANSFSWIGADPMMNNPPFGIHRRDKLGLDPYKIYNNTIVFRKSPSHYGAGTTLVGPETSTTHKNFVLNNIFIQTDDAEIIGNLDCDSGYEIYDGNIYFKSSALNKHPIFYRITCNGRKKNFYDLKSFLASDCLHKFRPFYPFGFESKGLEGNPLLNEMYVPSNEGIAGIKGVDIDALWPDSDSHFRGALSPN